MQTKDERRETVRESVARKRGWTAALRRFEDKHRRTPTREEAAEIRAAVLGTDTTRKAA